MRPDENELQCILYARNMYPPRFKKKTLIQKILFAKPYEYKSEFDINKCIVNQDKSLKTLWKTFGLAWEYSTYDIHGNEVQRSWEKDGDISGKTIGEFQNGYFNEEENIKCINYWIKVLYQKEIDLSVILENDRNYIMENERRLQEKADRGTTTRERIKKRVNYGWPIDRLINYLDESLGDYE